MDGFGTEFGPDGTQEPPPPRLFTDPLAGLVTGEAVLRPGVEGWSAVTSGADAWGSVTSGGVTPVAVPPPVPVPPVVVPRVARQARRPPAARGREPVVHAPLPASSPAPPQVAGGPERKGRGGLIGCLVVLGALGALLYPVLREIIDAVVDLLR